MAVIAPFKLDDARAASERAREPQRAHGRFGAAADQPHLFDGRDECADFPGEFTPPGMLCLARSNRIELRDMQNRQSHQEFRTAALARRASLPYELYCLRRRALPARLCGTPSHYFGKYIL